MLPTSITYYGENYNSPMGVVSGWQKNYMTTTHSVDHLARLTELAAAEVAVGDPSLFALTDTSDTEQAEWDAAVEDERAYWAESDGQSKTTGVTGTQIIWEDRGE